MLTVSKSVNGFKSVNVNINMWLLIVLLVTITKIIIVIEAKPEVEILSTSTTLLVYTTTPNLNLPSSEPPINNNNIDPLRYNDDKTYTCIVIELVKCHWETPNGQPTEDNNSTKIPNYRACKRVKKVERTKYFEFQFINIFVAFLSCSLFVWRKRKLEFDGYRKLSGRIGDLVVLVVVMAM
ncbi:22306_t:CDS:2 [Entrophospora sp. SA101]|nr:22306_t:CDS:2 [Entrophospora sp. SA101]